MQVVIAGTCVAGGADVGDDVALSHAIAHAEVGGVAIEVGVIKDELSVVAQLINYLATESVAADPDDLAVGRGQHRSSARHDDVYRAVNASAGTRGVECILQIARTRARDGNDQIG